MWSGRKRLAKQAEKMITRQASLLGNFIEVERQIVALIDIGPRAAQTLVHFAAVRFGLDSFRHNRFPASVILLRDGRKRKSRSSFGPNFQLRTCAAALSDNGLTRGSFRVLSYGRQEAN